MKYTWCIYLWFFCLSCFIIQQIKFASWLNSYNVELWEVLTFTKEKLDLKFFSFGSNSSKLTNHGKYNINKKVKYVVNIHVSDKFDVEFWFCIWMNSCILWNLNSKGSWECLIFFCWCVWIWMGVQWDNK